MGIIFFFDQCDNNSEDRIIPDSIDWSEDEDEDDDPEVQKIMDEISFFLNKN